MKQVTLLYLFPLVLSIFCDNETMLQNDLMTNYNRNVAPLSGIALVHVDVTFSLLSIIEFNQIKETLTTNAAFGFSWVDRNLAWNSSNYGNINETIFRQKQLWLPDVISANSVNGLENFGHDELSLLVASDGKVTWSSVETVETICKVNTEYFPYDIQMCGIRVINRAQTIKMMTLNMPFRYVALHGFTENGQWQIESTSGQQSVIGNLQLLEFLLTLKRRPGYYVTSLIMPTLVVAVLNCFVLMLPNSSGEKISFSITVFLSYMVLLTFTTDNLPRTSEYDPYIVNYVGIMLGLSFTSVVCSVISLMLQPIKAKMKSRETDDQSDHRISSHSDAPVICSSDSIFTPSEQKISISPTHIPKLKPENAWVDKTEQHLNRNKEIDTIEASAPSWITGRYYKLNYKALLLKFLMYFDFIACFCICFVTAFVTTRTMLILVNNN